MILALILAIEVRIEEAVTRTYRLHSSLSRSEKAVPVLRDGEVVAVCALEQFLPKDKVVVCRPPHAPPYNIIYI